jgi:hypothetical protein
MKTKQLVLSSLLLFLVGNSAFSQFGQGIIRFIEVKSDKNIVLEHGANFAASKSDECFIIDGNESKGYMELNFEGMDPSMSAKSITLVVNTADVEYAETLTGFSVFLGAQKLGSISQLSRNAHARIPLDLNFLNSGKNVTLTIKANGDDGLYLLSKKSGFGSYLAITY